MEKLDKLAKEMFAEFGFWTCTRVEQEDILNVIKDDLLWNIDQFHRGSISAFECIEQIRKKVEEL